jgi:glutaredoxin
MLKELGIEYQRIELGLDPEGRGQLMRQTGRMSFPHVVIHEQVVGDYQEVKALTAQPPRAAAPPMRDVTASRSIRMAA